MPSIVIAEKPDQARLYEGAVGSRYGAILAARGHLFELAEPEEVDPAWKSWSATLLRPASGFYPTRIKAEADAKRRFAAIREAARAADTIYVATDPDREGEGIGTNIVKALQRDAGWTGRVLRVLPLGVDQASLQKAFAEAQPGDAFRPLYQSFAARQQADQIYNLSLTRAASTLFKPSGWTGALPIGRVLTPTLGMVCRREREIAAFRPEDYFLPWVEVAGAAGPVRLTHAPPEADRIRDLSRAQGIAEAAARYVGPIRVRSQRKTQGPPPLFSLAKLQAEAARRYRWSVAKTTDVLQAIYEARAVTYPRSSEVSLPESEIANASAMLAGILRLPGMEHVTWASDGPVIRVRKGAFSDADLKGAAHFAIIPNVATVLEWPRLLERMSPDERRLFDLIARRHLAAIGPDRVYDSTRQWIAVEGREFAATGTVELVAGWCEAVGGAKAVEPDEEEQGDRRALPSFTDGEPVRAGATGVTERQTEPPPRYTDATLVIAMIEAWRHVDDPTLRAILKDTDGIGTEATRSGIVANLLKKGLLAPVTQAGGLQATEAAMQFYAILERAAPRVLDVGLTGRMELLLEGIKSGEISSLAAVNEIIAVAEAALATMQEAKKSGAEISAVPQTLARTRTTGRSKGKNQARPRPGTKARAGGGRSQTATGPSAASGARSPSAKAVGLARKLAAERGLELPAEALTDAAVLSQWIDGTLAAGPERRGEGDSRPSSKQVGFAERIASRRGIAVPPECYRDRLGLSRWIETHKA